MPIQRCQFQSDQSLEEFYSRKERKGVYRLFADKILELVNRINVLFIKTDLYAFTSHMELCIMAYDSEIGGEDLIRINSTAIGHYSFSYAVPEGKSPWKNASMGGYAKDLKEAIVYLLISMNETEAWMGNEELAELTKKHCV